MRVLACVSAGGVCACVLVYLWACLIFFRVCPSAPLGEDFARSDAVRAAFTFQCTAAEKACLASVSKHSTDVRALLSRKLTPTYELDLSSAHVKKFIQDCTADTGAAAAPPGPVDPATAARASGVGSRLVDALAPLFGERYTALEVGGCIQKSSELPWYWLHNLVDAALLSPDILLDG